MIELKQGVPTLTEAEAHGLINECLCGAPLDVIDAVFARYGVTRDRIPEALLLQLDAICQQAARAQVEERTNAALRGDIKLSCANAAAQIRLNDAPWHEQETLRDKLAMAALTGMLSDNATIRAIRHTLERNGIKDEATQLDAYGVMSYFYADAMLEARKQ